MFFAVISHAKSTRFIEKDGVPILNRVTFTCVSHAKVTLIPFRMNAGFQVKTDNSAVRIRHSIDANGTVFSIKTDDPERSC